MSVVVIVNPRSRANRRNPALAGQFASLVEGVGRVLTPQSLEEMATTARSLAQSPPRAIAIHGGDGTLHRTLAALLAAEWKTPLPPVAILPGGTMNVVAASLGLRARPEVLVKQLCDDVRLGRALATVSRPCLRVGETHGFVFGNGLMANFLEEYYAGRYYGAGRALWILARTMLSAFVRGSYAQRIFRRWGGVVTIDGERLPWNSLTGVGAATVREVGLGFKLNHRAQEAADQFGALAIFSGPFGLSRDLWAVHRGRGISPRRAWSAVARHMRIESENGESLYTIDGDVYRQRGPLDVSIGPSVTFVRPRPG